MRKKTITWILAAVLILSAMTVSASSVSEPVTADPIQSKDSKYAYTVTTTYTADSKDAVTDMADTITVENSKYKLDHVDYNLISEDDVMEEKEVAVTKQYEVNAADLKDKKYADASVTEDGIKYTYASEEVKEKPYKESIESYKDSDYVDAEPEFPSTDTITYHSDVTGEDSEQTLQYDRTDIIEKYAWRSDLSVPVTITDYDADYYEFHGGQIYYNSDKPAFSDGQLNLLLDDLGYAKENYRLSDIKWSGAAYTKNGVTCRDAVATGSRYCAKYRAYYKPSDADGAVTGTMYEVTATYKGTKETVVDGQKEYTIEAVGYYKKAAILTAKQWIIVAVIFIAVALACLFLLVIPFKKKKEKVKSKRQIRKDLKNI